MIISKFFGQKISFPIFGRVLELVFTVFLVTVFGFISGCGNRSNNGNDNGTIAPYNLIYSVNPATYSLDTTIPLNTPTHAGGAVSLYTIYPSLPDGLQLDPTSGVISGTPKVTISTVTFIVTASNDGGNTTVNLDISISAVAPSIAAQPNDQRVKAGASATFTVVATGSSPLHYLWRKNNSAIAGANTASFTTPVTTTADSGSIYSVVVSNSAGSVTSRDANLAVTALTPQPFSYLDIDNVTLNLYAWEGANTVLLSRSNTLSTSTMAAILDATDKSYTYYKTATGFTPANYKLYNGKLTIADVPTTCGAGCSFLGATGIEIQNTYFDLLYNQVNTKNQYDQVVFYEFGRNFWNLSNKIEYYGADGRPGSITTGFAVFMRFMAMETAGVQGAAPLGWATFADFTTSVETMIDLYLADPTQTWATTLKLGKPQANNPSNLGATDLFASFCFRLRRDYGGNAFIYNLWKEAAKRPAITSTQDAVDNFFLAASSAANKNLTTLFETTWRWPLSDTAKISAMNFPN